MNSLIICRGIPGSGKTTWALSQVSDTVCACSMDRIREVLGTPFSHQREKQVGAIRDMIVSDALNRGLTVIVDDTNLSYSALWIRIAMSTGVCHRYEDFPTPIEECYRRNSLRTGVDKVPRHVIDTMYKKAIKIGLYHQTITQ